MVVCVRDDSESAGVAHGLMVRGSGAAALGDDWVVVDGGDDVVEVVVGVIGGGRGVGRVGEVLVERPVVVECDELHAEADGEDGFFAMVGLVERGEEGEFEGLSRGMESLGRGVRGLSEVLGDGVGAAGEEEGVEGVGVLLGDRFKDVRGDDEWGGDDGGEGAGAPEGSGVGAA